MTADSTKPLQSFSPITMQNAFRFFAGGASIHVVAQQCKVTVDEALELQRLYVESRRARLASDRIQKRDALRSKAMAAANLLEQVAAGRHPAITGLDEDGEDIPQARLAAMQKFLPLQVQAARAILSSGTSFFGESLLEILVERAEDSPAESDGTVFDFEALAREDGGATVVLLPKAVGGAE